MLCYFYIKQTSFKLYFILLEMFLGNRVHYNAVNGDLDVILRGNLRKLLKHSTYDTTSVLSSIYIFRLRGSQFHALVLPHIMVTQGLLFYAHMYTY